jgi:hypothetical protein
MTQKFLAIFIFAFGLFSAQQDAYYQQYANIK